MFGFNFSRIQINRCNQTRKAMPMFWRHLCVVLAVSAENWGLSRSHTVHMAIGGVDFWGKGAKMRATNCVVGIFWLLDNL